MYKIAVMGDYDSIYGFAAVGLDIYALTDEEEARKQLGKIVDSDHAVIYITEEWAERLAPELEQYKDSLLPAIIPVPGVRGNTGDGILRVKKFVEQAVGSDILFSGDE